MFSFDIISLLSFDLTSFGLDTSFVLSLLAQAFAVLAFAVSCLVLQDETHDEMYTFEDEDEDCFDIASSLATDIEAFCRPTCHEPFSSCFDAAFYRHIDDERVSRAIARLDDMPDCVSFDDVDDDDVDDMTQDDTVYLDVATLQRVVRRPSCRPAVRPSCRPAVVRRPSCLPTFVHLKDAHLMLFY